MAMLNNQRVHHWYHWIGFRENLHGENHGFRLRFHGLVETCSGTRMKLLSFMGKTKTMVSRFPLHPIQWIHTHKSCAWLYFGTSDRIVFLFFLANDLDIACQSDFKNENAR